MRKFSPKKLYKLAKILVIIIVVLSLFMAAASYNRINSNDFTQMINNCNQLYPTRISDETELSLWSGCHKSAYDVLQLQQEIFQNAVAVAVLLPLIFFGGTWFFKYIFPMKDKT